jgi:aconitate decarboxylase
VVTDGGRATDEIITVRDKIGAAADGSGAADETYVSLTLGGETNIEKHISHALGSLEVPMTDARLERKFIDQCLPI